MSLDDAIITQMIVHTASEAAREKLMGADEKDKFEYVLTRAAQAEQNVKEAGEFADRRSRLSIGLIGPQDPVRTKTIHEAGRRSVVATGVGAVIVSPTKPNR